MRLPDITRNEPAPWLEPIASMNTPLGLQGIRLFGQEPVHSVIVAMLDAINMHADEYRISLLLPQLPGVLPVLLGMGFRVFSVAPVMIPYLAATVKEIVLALAQARARQVCAAKDSKTVRELL